MDPFAPANITTPPAPLPPTPDLGGGPGAPPAGGQVPGQAPAPAPPQQQAPQNSGFLGMAPSFWQNLMNFGANMSVAANARTPQGFLEYGTGFAGPMGAAIGQTEEQAQNYATAQSQRQLQQAQAAQVQSETSVNELKVPMMQSQIAIMRRLANQNSDGSDNSGGINPAVADTSQGGPGPGSTGLTGAVIGQLETGNGENAYSKVNSGGYAGRYQVGAAEMAAANLYTPAKGESLSSNSWGGTFNVPGYGPASFAQFMASKNMQDAAFQVAQSYNWQELKKSGATDYIGQTVGGVPITQVSLLAGRGREGRWVSPGFCNPMAGTIPPTPIKFI